MKIDNTNIEQQAQNKTKTFGQKAWEVFKVLLRIVDVVCRVASWLEVGAE